MVISREFECPSHQWRLFESGFAPLNWYAIVRRGEEGLDGMLRRRSMHPVPMQDFRQLRVWQRAHALAIEARTTETFPRTGYAELKSQITRAADSIASNIVEGCAAASRQEFARFLDISIKSASELDYRFQLARALDVLRYDVWKSLAREIVEIRKMLSGLRRTVLAAAEREKRQKRPRADSEETGTENG